MGNSAQHVLDASCKAAEVPRGGGLWLRMQSVLPDRALACSPHPPLAGGRCRGGLQAGMTSLAREAGLGVRCPAAAARDQLQAKA